MPDLDAMLSAVVAHPADDLPLLAFADWLDDRDPATPVAHSDLPTGFHRWFVGGPARGRFLARGRSAFPGAWSTSAVLPVLAEVAYRGGAAEYGCPDWFDHGGAAVVLGVPVLVGEPYADDGRCVTACRRLAPLFGCPVTFARAAHHNTVYHRIVVWFTKAALVARKGRPRTNFDRRRPRRAPDRPGPGSEGIVAAAGA